MNTNEIAHRVEEVGLVAASGEHSQAVALECQLHRDVLYAVANGHCADPVGCARAALTTGKIELPRPTVKTPEPETKPAA